MDTPLLVAQRIAARYGRLPQVEAVALAGSQASGKADRDSDIDLYVYLRAELPLEARREIATAQAKYAEVNNQFWEPGDEWIDAETGIHVDVMFRTVAWITEQLERVLRRHEAGVGYSTCFWYNVITARVLYDRAGWFQKLQQEAQQPYPEELRRAIIAKNHPILRRSLSSYRYQLERAHARNDSVSLNHRVAALLASYFDILFAVNRMPHPGEKRLAEIAVRQCAKLPEAMNRHLNDLLAAAALGKDVVDKADVLMDGLERLLRDEGLDYFSSGS